MGNKGSKKGVITVSSRGAVAWIDHMSKGMLADLVVDLIRQNEGNERLDGRRLVVAIREAAEPVARVRGDRLAGVDWWEQSLEKAIARSPGATWVGGAEAALYAWRAVQS